MTERIRVYCEEEEKYETLIDLIVSAAYYWKKGVNGSGKEVRFKQKPDGFEFVFPMYCPKVYKDYLKGKYEKLRLEHLGI